MISISNAADKISGGLTKERLLRHRFRDGIAGPMY